MPISQGRTPSAKKLLEAKGRWILAVSRNLAGFSVSNNPSLARLWATTTAGRSGELLFRIRGLQTVPMEFMIAVGSDIGIARQAIREELNRIQTVTRGTIEVHDERDNRWSLQENILSESQVCIDVARMFEALEPDPIEPAIILVLELTSKLPSSLEEINEHCGGKGLSEDVVNDAVERMIGFGLLNTACDQDSGKDLYYNDYLWGDRIEAVAPAIQNLTTSKRHALISLVEEIQANPGIALSLVTTVPPELASEAARIGIIDATTISTTTGDEQMFAFTPNFYGYSASGNASDSLDHSQQVKLFVSSMEYGSRFSTGSQLLDPVRFVERLLADGEAGRAAAILRDYPLLELNGIVRVKQVAPNSGRFVMLKRDIVEQSLELMKKGAPVQSILSNASGAASSASRFGGPEQTRLNLARQLPQATTSLERSQLVTSLRETTLGLRW